MLIFFSSFFFFLFFLSSLFFPDIPWKDTWKIQNVLVLFHAVSIQCLMFYNQHVNLVREFVIVIQNKSFNFVPYKLFQCEIFIIIIIFPF